MYLIQSSCYRKASELQCNIASFLKNNCYSLTFVPFIILYFFIIFSTLENISSELDEEIWQKAFLMIEGSVLFWIFSLVLSYCRWNLIWLFLLFSFSLCIIQLINFYLIIGSTDEYFKELKDNLSSHRDKDLRISNQKINQNFSSNIFLYLSAIFFLFLLLNLSKNFSKLEIQGNIISY